MTLETNRPWRRQPTVEELVRDAEFLALKAQGLTYPQIAQLKGCGLGTAHRRVSAAMKTYLQDRGAEQIKTEMLARLDAMVAMLMPRVLNGDLQAVDRLLKVEQRMATLIGTDAPKVIKVQPVPVATIDDEIRALERRLAENDDRPQPALDE